jgi:acyl-CoA thioester hydrolase
MNNSVSYLLFDTIINSYLIAHCGLTPPSSPQLGLVVSSHASYFAPTSFPSRLDLGLRVIKLGSNSVEYEVGIFEEGKDTPAVVGGYTHVFVNNQTRRSMVMDGKVRQGLEKLLSLDHLPDVKAKL